jgi:hypothetical protein
MNRPINNRYRCLVAVTLASALLPTFAVAADEDMRCGNYLVSRKSTVAELLHKCGVPSNKESKTEDIRNRTEYGSAVVGQTTTEKWTYVHGSRQLPRVVTIIDGTIVNIETITR